MSYSASAGATYADYRRVGEDSRSNSSGIPPAATNPYMEARDGVQQLPAIHYPMVASSDRPSTHQSSSYADLRAKGYSTSQPSTYVNSAGAMYASQDQGSSSNYLSTSQLNPTPRISYSNSAQFTPSPPQYAGSYTAVASYDRGSQYPYQRVGEAGSYGDVNIHNERHNFYSRRFTRDDAGGISGHSTAQRYTTSSVASGGGVLGQCSKSRIVSGNFYVCGTEQQPMQYQRVHTAPAAPAPARSAAVTYTTRQAEPYTETRKRVVQVPVTVMQEQVIEERVQVGQNYAPRPDRDSA